MLPAAFPNLVSSSSCGDFHSILVDGFLMTGFLVSVLLSLLVLRAVHTESEVVLPAARTFVAVLCVCDITLGLLAAVQMALAHVDCSVASAMYALLSSAEMFAQMLSFVCASAVAGVVVTVFWSRGSEVGLPGPRGWCALITICCMPASSHVLLCATGGSEVCLSACGYSNSKASIESRLKQANELAGAVLLLCCSACAAVCVLRFQRTTTSAAVRDRH